MTGEMRRRILTAVNVINEIDAIVGTIGAFYG